MESDHLRIVVDGGGTAEREGPPAPPEPPERPARQRSTLLKPALALPTDRMRFETQAAALQTFAGASNRGEEAVGAAQIADRISVSEATASLVNNFFVEAGFLTKEGKGRYK